MNPLILVCLAVVPTSAVLCTIAAQFMRSRSFGQRVRTVGPTRHRTKAGTPTMGGGVLLLLWIAVVAVLHAWHPLTEATAFVLATGGLFGAIGAADDLLSVRKRRSLGLSATAKLVLSTAATVFLFLLFHDALSVPARIPFTDLSLTLPPVAVFALTWIVFLATTNGMNLTDGLDGLAPGIAILILIGALLLSPSPTILVVVAPLIASLVGFLWINAHPAGLFLGDVGSFFIGGVIASLCLVNGTAFFLPILAGVLVLEVGSVILQVVLFRTTGRRLFRMSPLHHSFEPANEEEREHILPAFCWPEEKVTIRFWILEAGFVGLALMASRF